MIELAVLNKLLLDVIITYYTKYDAINALRLPLIIRQLFTGR